MTKHRGRKSIPQRKKPFVDLDRVSDTSNTSREGGQLDSTSGRAPSHQRYNTTTIDPPFKGDSDGKHGFVTTSDISKIVGVVLVLAPIIWWAATIDQGVKSLQIEVGKLKTKSEELTIISVKNGGVLESIKESLDRRSQNYGQKFQQQQNNEVTEKLPQE